LFSFNVKQYSNTGIQQILFLDLNAGQEMFLLKTLLKYNYQN